MNAWNGWDGMHMIAWMGWEVWDGMHEMKCLGRMNGMHEVNAWDGWKG